jgi:hypothetical protein
MTGKDQVRAAWTALCKAQGVEPGALFVIFNETTPEYAEYQRLVHLWLPRSGDTQPPGPISGAQASSALGPWGAVGGLLGGIV